ncbi:uncharacterized protein LOC127811581 isoform X3 [Diospyros lotus]|uniref:uncharacterized protein LOC127811581 isoform X3 n=1 Tax=Diospyros lotus TaxID=55363 RepID=UPI0022556118|nr:uncharacterized protein LOC127811581 isoform X3 [Diospyros lotus]
MSFDGDSKQWICGKTGIVSLNLVSSIVRDIGEPCLHQTVIKVAIGSKMLRPEKWQATFDGDGKILGFRKALKSIILGGVDPSIRPEVWEFLLGCYNLSSTADYRRQLRTARRERYSELVKQCQMMHSSIGTGSLAYVVGSKVMDMRTMSKDNGRREAEAQDRHTSDYENKLDSRCDWDNHCTDTAQTCKRESSSDSGDLVTVRGSTDSAAYESSCFMPSSDPCNCHSPKPGSEANGSRYLTESYFDFPPLPVTNLFENTGKESEEHEFPGDRHSMQLQYKDGHMHTFQINNNIDLIMESSGSPSDVVSHALNCEIEMVQLDVHEPLSPSKDLEYKKEIINRLRISDVPETLPIDVRTSQMGPSSEDRVSEWLWTLHRIVVDVVRTDNHLEFYEDAKNLARMSDILAVYAWVDPATGYCQGMSDLLSPFVVLFEDNADAFWCFEMLLRRMMEGPTGVMKQLQSLWHILKLTDKEMFAHLSRIGAESLHFAFRMLLVLFRRELSFNEALCMWEMMWAADFDESLVYNLERSCLEPLVIQIPRESVAEMAEESIDNGNIIVKGGLQSNHGNGERSTPDDEDNDDDGITSASTHAFCGLAKGFWSKNDQLHMCTVVTSTRNGDNDLPVFCVAAILVTNRQKIIRETSSIDDLIKIFNDRMLKIRVKRCIRTAMKLRKKYLDKLIKNGRPAAPARQEE